mmetsp:Transcript_39657/g.71145  ORF Transcript_39657/g.71145 Transcript_39657/m.71145 type:complete len:805 (-) Transcript_39657:121-2535(-)
MRLPLSWPCLLCACLATHVAGVSHTTASLRSRQNGLRENSAVATSPPAVEKPPKELLTIVRHAASNPQEVLASLTPGEAVELRKHLSLLSLALEPPGDDGGKARSSSARPAAAAMARESAQPSAEHSALFELESRGANTSSAITAADMARQTSLSHTMHPGGDIAEALGLDFKKLSTLKMVPFLAGAAIIALTGVVIFEITHYRCSDTNLGVPMEYGEENKESQLLRLFAGVIPLVKPYFRQRCSWWFLVALGTLGLVDLGLNLIFMLWMKEFWDCIEHKEGDRFFPLMKVFCLIVTTAILSNTYTSYVSLMMAVNWRRFLTEWLLQKWMQRKAFYRLQLGQSGMLDNPDQRIQEDVWRFIQNCLALGGGLLAAAGSLVTMLPMLLILSPDYAFGLFYCPGWLLYLAMLYSGLGTLAAHLIGSRLILINFVLQKYEANFRYYIVQVRDHAESIALYGSEDCERSRIEGMFDWIVRGYWLLMLYTKRLGFFRSFYMQTSVTFPYLVLAPNYFKGQITLGDMFMLFSALNAVKGSLDWCISSYTTLTDFRSTVDRLLNFSLALDATPKEDVFVRRLSAAPQTHPGAALVAEDVSVSLPPAFESRRLWSKAGLVVQPGQFVLLSAPEGSGKSCFFRALAGIWPHATGSVYLGQEVLFVPQKPFIPQGTLKQAVAYPELADRFTDKEVTAALEAVGLEAVYKRELSEDANWQLALSGGEMQRLAIAHAVLKKPQVLLLDEATSALSETGTLEVYGLLRRQGILPQGAAVVSVSHDVQLLAPVHDVHYTYDAKTAGWKDAATPRWPFQG